jgi:membrane protease YdiL (CAAX protease family)
MDVVPVEPPVPDRWGGLPPVGERPVGDRWAYAGEVVTVFFIWLAVWAVYRYLRSVSGVDDTVLGPVLSAIAPVVLTLSIPLLWWRMRRRERGIPFLVTRRHLFTSIFVACVAVVAFFAFYYLSYPVLVNLMGIETTEELSFWAVWRAQSAAWLVATTLFYMVIVGPVEELFHRGFVQDQINRAFPAYFGILVASVVFVLGHVPIDIMVNRLTFAEWGLRWCSSFPFAIGMGVFYHWSRNIWGMAVYHGLYDWFLSVNNLEYGLSGPDLGLFQTYVLFIVWFLVEMVFIVLFAYAGYRLWWRGDRPAGSLGFRMRGVSHPTSPDRKWLHRARSFLGGRFVVRLATRLDRSRGWRPEMMALGMVFVVLLGNLALTGALGTVPPPGTAPGLGPLGPGDDGKGLRTLPLQTEHGYVYEGDTQDFPYRYAENHRYVHINVTLTWQDEAPPARYTNEPDTLRLEVQVDDGSGFETIAQDSSATGTVTLRWSSEDNARLDTVMVSVTAVECGNMVPTINPLGLRERADTGNSFNLEVELVIVDE